MQALLARQKRYPRRAQRRRQEGVASLFFVLDRSGKVLDYKIRKSSGHRLLDEEVERMIRRVQPLPPFPAALTMARVEVVVPVSFSLR